MLEKLCHEIIHGNTNGHTPDSGAHKSFHLGAYGHGGSGSYAVRHRVQDDLHQAVGSRTTGTCTAECELLFKCVWVTVVYNHWIV